MDEERIKQERERLSKYVCPESDRREGRPSGVLLSDEIEYYIAECKLIDPLDRERLKPAGYELTVGDEYALGGEAHRLKVDGEIRIQPFDVVVIKTNETINLPRFLIARWNLRVKWAYEGLLWVGAAQVDPGWVGHLFCPLYNLSDREVGLRFGDPIALMDFVTTTPFDPAKCKIYQRPPKRVLLEEYRAAELKSALVTQAKQAIERIEARTGKDIEDIRKETRGKMDRLEDRMNFFLGSGLVILTILFTIVAIFTTYEKDTIVPVWPNVSAVISILALALAFWAWRRNRRPR